METTINQNYIKVVAKEGCVLTYKDKTFNEGILPINIDLTQIKEIKNDDCIKEYY